MRKNGSVFVRGCTHKRKDANLQFVGAQQLMGERKKTCVRPKTPPKPVREEPTDQNRGECELTRDDCVREKNGKRGWSGQVGKGLTVLPPHSQRH